MAGGGGGGAEQLCVFSFLIHFSSASSAFIMESLRRAFSPFSKGRSSRRDNEEPMLSEDGDYEGSTEPTATPYNAVEMVSQDFTVFTRIATVYRVMIVVVVLWLAGKHTLLAV